MPDFIVRFVLPLRLPWVTFFDDEMYAGQPCVDSEGVEFEDDVVRVPQGDDGIEHQHQLLVRPILFTWRRVLRLHAEGIAHADDERTE